MMRWATYTCQRRRLLQLKLNKQHNQRQKSDLTHDENDNEDDDMRNLPPRLPSTTNIQIEIKKMLENHATAIQNATRHQKQKDDDSTQEEKEDDDNDVAKEMDQEASQTKGQEKEEAAAVYIQSWFKGVMMRNRFNKHRVQEQGRQTIEMERQKQMKQIAADRQRAIERRKQITEMDRQRQSRQMAARCIQLWFKGVTMRRMYINHRKQIRKRQIIDMHRQRHSKHIAAMRIQSWFKRIMMHRIRNDYHKQEQRKQIIRMEQQKQMRHNAAECIQLWFRTAVWKRRFDANVREHKKEEERIAKEDAALVIQSWIKGNTHRKEYHALLLDKKKVASNDSNYIQRQRTGLEDGPSVAVMLQEEWLNTTKKT